MIYYLHKGLGVIAGPLLEVAALFEPSKTRKERCKCNTVEGLKCVPVSLGFNIPSINLIKDALGL